MKQAAALASILLMFLALLSTEMVLANPSPQPSVKIQSPINNQVYTTNTVELKAIAYAYPSYVVNFTIEYYVLDNQPSVPTNGTAILNDLTSGSHELKLYGTFSTQNGNHKQNDALVSITYFSVNYSTQWFIFSVTLSLVLMVTCLTLYWKRRQIKTALKTKRSDMFFFGLAMLIISILPVITFAWQRLSLYLFPYWPPRGFESVSLLPILLISPFFLLLGLFLMWFGKNKKTDTTAPLVV